MKLIGYDEFNEKAGSRDSKNDVDPVMIRKILSDVKQAGDKALKMYTLEYDGEVMDGFTIEKEEFSRALEIIAPATRQALELAARNLDSFAARQFEQMQDFECETQPGVFTGQRVLPIERIGVYVPGGNFPLVSSLLMGSVPARRAGVGEIAVCTPPGAGGHVMPEMLAAAAIAGVDRLHTVGGVQAVGALAYGTETIGAVDKIVGPGNQYVTAAKKEVFGKVGIDFVAGPSEVMVIADESAYPAWIAADMLAQAEHDTMASAILVTDSHVLAKQVETEIRNQLQVLETAAIARESLETNGAIVVVESMAQAVQLANREAPEHLELQMQDAELVSRQLINYGTLFIGGLAAEVLGDYSSGLNHTLPTSGAARYTGGLSVRDFVKVMTTLRVDKTGMTSISDTAYKMALLEGLTGHANAITVRK